MKMPAHFRIGWPLPLFLFDLLALNILVSGQEAPGCVPVPMQVAGVADERCMRSVCDDGDESCGAGFLLPSGRGDPGALPGCGSRAVIVVDTNVVAYLLLPSPHTEAVERLRAADSDWLAPGLWRYEFLNILWMHVQHDGLDRAAAEELGAYALGPLKVLEQNPDPLVALTTACRERLSAYDSQFVALARALGVPLYTFDRQVLSRCGDVALRPTDLWARPKTKGPKRGRRGARSARRVSAGISEDVAPAAQPIEVRGALGARASLPAGRAALRTPAGWKPALPGRPVCAVLLAGPRRSTRARALARARRPATPKGPSRNNCCIRTLNHPGWLRCSPSTYPGYDSRSRLASRPPRRPRCTQVVLARAPTRRKRRCDAEARIG